MFNKVVTLAVLFQMALSCKCTRLIPVYDLNTEERFAFPEDFLKLVLEYQSLDETEESQYSVPEQLDEEGYIINENGQLVPFRLYKKGLHPRNCRGGFHKRLTDGPARDGVSNDLYELKVYKRKLETTQNHKDFRTPYRVNDDVMFAPGYKAHSPKHLSQPSKFSDHDFEAAELDDSVFGLFPSLKAESFKNDINEFGISETDFKTLQDMKKANLLLDDISRDLEQVADPPPLETGSKIKADMEEYPAFELYDDYGPRNSDNVQRHKDVSLLSPAETVDLYAFRREM